jgi:hypothetical protein
MKRAMTLLFLALTALMSFALYQIADRVRAQEKELRALNRALMQERENIDVLKAEWSLMTRPERLEGLAGRHLALAPLKPSQVTKAALLPLPAEDLAASVTAAGGQPLGQQSKAKQP